MTDTPRRIFGIVCLLVAVWIVTYWVYEPAEPPVTFGERPASISLAEVTQTPAPQPPEPEPDPEPEPVTVVVADPSQAQAPRTVSRLEPPAFREYVVQQGDTSLQVIAKRELGDSRYWVAIAQANPYLDPAKLYPGRTRLRIPLDPTNIQGRVVEVPAGDAAADPAPAQKPPEPEDIEYTVAPGDTLSGIAQRFYGDPGRWRTIYEANRAVLGDPDRLKSGMKLKIPPKAAR